SSLSMCMKSDKHGSPYFYLLGHPKDTERSKLARTDNRKDEPAPWSSPAAAAPGLPEVGVSLDD
ncbi:MAGI2 isoform 9, partial [Pan troglodytes]